MRILAIDPGYDRCGVAVLDISGTNPVVLHSTCVTTSSALEHGNRLAEIYAAITSIIQEWQPGHLAIETLFFSANKTTALKVAEARGVLLAAAAAHGMAIIELSPKTIKASMTGNGNATKEQVQKMVGLAMKIDLSKKIDDEVDAIAIGYAAMPIAKQKKF